MSVFLQKMRNALLSIRADSDFIRKRKRYVPSTAGLPSPILSEPTLVLAPVGSGTGWVVCEIGIRHSTPIKDEHCSFIGWIESEVPDVRLVPRVWRPMLKPWAKTCYNSSKPTGDWVPAGVRRVLEKARRLAMKTKMTINKASSPSKRLGERDRSDPLVATPTIPKAAKRNRRMVRKCLFPDEEEMFFSCECVL